MSNSKKNFYTNNNTNSTNSTNNKKMEVSFKATFQFTDDMMANNKKIEISPNINLHNPNIVNVNVSNGNLKKNRLEKIPESRLNNEIEHEDTY